MMDGYNSLEANLSNSKRSKAQALRAAGLKLIKDSRYQHPFYRAGF
jgi:CHAT domain-containing protein